MAHGLRLVFEPDGEAAVERAVREDALLLVAVQHTPQDAARIAARLRRTTDRVSLVVLLAGPAAHPEMEQRIIDAGADAVAYYPLPAPVWVRLWRLIVDGRQRCREQAALPVS